jgi:hypothetical protein
MINEEKWYVLKDINKLIEKDKREQFEKYIIKICDMIINQPYKNESFNPLSVKRYKEHEGYMYIKFSDPNDGEGNIRVNINDFWDFEDNQIIKTEYFGRWDCPFRF